jgi:Group 4 capsule polysaccharide lipoprotein gfcB, YjbF
MGAGMGMNRFKVVCGLLVALFLSGCSAGDDIPSLELQVIEATRAAIAAKTAGTPPRITITRAMLNDLDGSFLEVTLERKDQLAYLELDAKRRDSLPGNITIWRTFDDVSLATRNGMLISITGIGGGIASSSVLASGNTPGPAYDGEHILFIRALDNKEIRLSMVCEVVRLGSETIEIIEYTHTTQHVQERCEGGGGTVVNDFWIDSRAGLIRQSRQWAGPNIGYLRIRRLTN